jgi:CDP-glucose 4,6-dehydratase
MTVGEKADMNTYNMLNDFYKGKKVLVTGHTGFKGAWMCHVLKELGADVAGYALKPPTTPNLFELSHAADGIKSVQGDIRDLEHLKIAFRVEKPEIVIHMAAQPIVREAYNNPVYTYDVNVMGTVNVLESVRLCDSVRSFLNVTTDKVYRNREWDWGYRENEELNGYDPYSNSKSCSELVTDSYKNSFFSDKNNKVQNVAVSTARAGNVIGGGDFAADRIIPDCMRAVLSGEDIIIRNPHSTRPYQHVLEPIIAYLMIAMRQYNDSSLLGSYNVGPEDTSCITTGELVEKFCAQWNTDEGHNASWRVEGDGGPHEANFLKLDNSKIKNTIGWKPKWNIDYAIKKTVDWIEAYYTRKDTTGIMYAQIREYLEMETN